MSDIGQVFDHWVESGRAATMTDGHQFSAALGFEALDIGRTHQALDIGCGLGYAVEWMAQSALDGKVVGVDLSSNMIAASRERCAQLRNTEFICGEFPGAVDGVVFDRIFSVEALYYSQNLRQTLNDVYSRLRSGGRFVTVIDFYRENAACHNWSERVGVPLTLWSIEEWAQQLVQIGFINVNATQHPHPAGPNTAEWQENVGSLLIVADKT